MKFLYEMYETGSKGIVFKGYKSVISDDASSAEVLALSGLNENIKLFRVYVPQEA